MLRDHIYSVMLRCGGVVPGQVHLVMPRFTQSCRSAELRSVLQSSLLGRAKVPRGAKMPRSASRLGLFNHAEVPRSALRLGSLSAIPRYRVAEECATVRFIGLCRSVEVSKSALRLSVLGLTKVPRSAPLSTCRRLIYPPRAVELGLTEVNGPI
ncbi:hypothetical protein NE237_029161 [Protea cynaroides]|uniref:Uncharacterized protein n=1 Tax=Protea cynaroides TaxID=273540 RepID=A0A9Q0GVA2_9MAGN|nr:hypothetical protein NE237_029161 [Protea cynaroides]